MEKLRIGIIGVGNIGFAHAKSLFEAKIKNAELTALCDISSQRLADISESFPGIAQFEDYKKLLESNLADAVIIAVPHYSHAPIAVDCFDAGLHVLTEKPAGVYTRQARQMIKAAKNSGKTFGIMFNQRTHPLFAKAKEIVDSGALGRKKRFVWIITNWYRNQAYYNSGGWRATWSGEGGGVLLNQCPHNLDLWQWICGLPVKIQAVCHEGKWHDIEVEDDVTIYAEYANGATGTFITTTGDCPGTNRFEITLDGGKIICENNQLRVYKLKGSTAEHCATSEEGFGRVEGEWIDVETDGLNEQHSGVTRAFAAHILRGEALVANGEEGIRGLSISNAAHLSSWLGKAVELPVDEDVYFAELQKKIASSTGEKKVVKSVSADLSGTYGS